MEPWQEPIFEEKRDLDTKIANLNAFMKTPQFTDRITDNHRSLLREQALAMATYSEILGARLTFEPFPE